MLHVILQILAIIGIVLLCILGLVLLLVTVVLFVPVRYAAEGKRDTQETTLLIKAAYLLHMLTVKYQYPEPGGVVVKLFGIKIFESLKNTEVPWNTETSKTGIAEEQKAEDIETNSENSAEEKKATEEKATEEKAGNSADSVNAQAEGEENTEKKTIADKIQYTFHEICDKIKNIIAKIRRISENVSYYREVLTKPENKKMYGRMKKRAVKVLKSIRPQVIRADLHIGTGQPDTTAYIYGVYGMLMPVFGKNSKHIRITPDFENTVYEGTVFFKGKITIFSVLVQAGKVLLDRQLYTFLKQLKRDREE